MILHDHLLRTGTVLIASKGVYTEELYLQEGARVAVIEYSVDDSYLLRVQLTETIWYLVKLPKFTVFRCFDVQSDKTREEPTSAERIAELSKEDLYNYVRGFIAEQKISCPESIHQTDRVALSACEFVEKCCEYVGYAREIMVNGVAHSFCGETISYREVVKLAGYEYRDCFTMTYRGPKHGDSQRSGTLTFSQSVPLELGMKFDVVMTGNA